MIPARKPDTTGVAPRCAYPRRLIAKVPGSIFVKNPMMHHQSPMKIWVMAKPIPIKMWLKIVEPRFAENLIPIAPRSIMQPVRVIIIAIKLFSVPSSWKEIQGKTTVVNRWISRIIMVVPHNLMFDIVIYNRSALQNVKKENFI